VRRSFGGAFGVSAVTHAAVVLLVLFVTGRMPPPVQLQPAGSSEAGGIVWIPRTDRPVVSRPETGGGGSGDEDPETASRAEAPGNQRLTVTPAAAPPASDSHTIPPAAQVLIDALPMRSGLTEIPGVIEAPPSTSISLGPGEGGSAGDGRGRGSGRGDGGGLGEGRGGNHGGSVYDAGAGGVSYPRLVREVPPMYTNGAMRARVEGIVELCAIVRADGSVGEVWVTRSLDSVFGLDREALRAVRLWRFVPALRAGRAVDAVVPIEIRFTIR
jgi:periplasmic protein TonB